MSAEAEFDSASFRALVGEYELLLDSAPSLSREDFERCALALLPRLYAAGAVMSSGLDTDDDGSDDADETPADESAVLEVVEWVEDSEPSPEFLEWQQRHGVLEGVLGDHSTYFAALNPADPEVTRGDLADDLVDILGDLREGAAHYDEGRVQDAIWHWSLTVWHWGDHATGAMVALHRHVIWGDDKPDDLMVDVDTAT